ncbi:Ig-like domain-containing protein [Marixanthomonas spongiae]|uniref:Repeat protein (TIGR01451 family)/gliding motility-associated-like protein n=1 Tax=Marixanthomonas spongiae TaxID=2174845 RepID=A0A2U0HVD3_9FLAO|nr:gliding motility-associated C-terminal domain-containing protein [Marixanthomonas spongiae]PVW12833.1 hypothetical protein DDV96_14505 [Marixanthomonas spongiae]
MITKLPNPCISRFKYLLLCVVVLFDLAQNDLYAQTQVYANQVTFEDHVDNAAEATQANGNFATLNSYGGIAVGVLSYTGELELQFPSTVPANTTTFVRIDFDNDVLNSLLGGSLGNLLADVLGNVILGNHYFDIEARYFDGNSSNTVFSSTSRIPPSNARYRIVKDADSNFYIAITPDEDYNRIYIEDNTDALLVGLFHSMNVYNISYFTDNQCAIDPLFTDFDGQGLTVDLLDIGGAGVTNPEYVIDENPDNFSEVSLGVIGILASIRQNVYFPTSYQPDKEFSVTLKTEPTLVTLGLLNNVQVIAHNDGVEVYSENLSSILSLDLLTLLQNGEKAEIVFAPGVAFDRVSVRLTSLLNVNIAQSIDVYEIAVVGPDAPTADETDQQFCAVDNPTVADIDVNEPNVIWYDQATGGTAYDPTDELIDGNSYYGAQIVDGCESEDRLEVTIIIEDAPTPTTDETTQDFCLVDNPTVADIDVNETDVTWYDQATGGTPYDPTDALIDGTIYYASLTDATSGCESSVRLEVTVNVGDAPTPTTDETIQDFCLVDNPTVADIDVNEPDVTWYDQATGGTPYDPTDALIDGTIYYASLTDATSGCESSVRLEVTVNVGDAPTPTTDETTQDFCLVDNPTVADIDVNEPDVTWYDQATGGTPYDPTDALIDGNIYYASLTDAASGCESSVRLEVTVNVGDAPTPTTDETIQDFCLVDNPTVADIDVNEPDVTWYDQPTGGTPYDPTDALIDGNIYYASLTDATSGCESSVRLEVTVNVGDAPTPTTDETIQDFCLVDNPTVADIDVNETDVTWYDQATGGTPYDPTDALIDGNIYYASLTDAASGCESSVRLEVTVNVGDGSGPVITSSTQDPVCLETTITYSTEPGHQNYLWTITGGIVMSGGDATDSTVTVLWDSTDDTTVSVSYDSTNTCTTGGTTTFVETVSVCADITIDKTVDKPEPMIGETVTFTITVANAGPNDFTDLEISEDIPSGFELVDYTASIGTYNPSTSIWQIDLLPAEVTATLEVRAEVLGQGDYTNIASIISSNPTDSDVSNNSSEISVDPLCLIVYNEFTPNGDGVNDRFVISCIENYPNNKLQIFNRYGSVVYKANNYSNEWDGRANVSGISNKGEVLPAGTYFYILEFDTIKSKSGWIYLAK